MNSDAELETTIASLAREAGGSLIIGAKHPISRRPTILEPVAKYRLPSLSVDRQFAEEGALMSYACREADRCSGCADHPCYLT